MKGYKVFNEDWTCKGYSFKNEIGEVIGTTHTIEGKFEICKNGFHFCKNLIHCFNYYEFNPKNKVAEIRTDGETINNGNKFCAKTITIIRELSWTEVLDLVNIGEGNTGQSNSGHSNSGNWNSGNWNSGHSNSGNWNSGNWNSGHSNSGNRNSGHGNSGHSNSGNLNAGNRNSGYSNSGNLNAGNRNSGNLNAGDWNSGNRNSGNSNSGNWNSGNLNAGDWNSGNRNVGYFNSENQNITVFNKKCDIDIWNKTEKPNFLYFFLLKDKTYKESFLASYLKAKEKEDWEKQFNLLINLPNFNKEVFRKISGIDIDKD